MELTNLYQLKPHELRSLIDATDGIHVSLIMPVQQEPDKRDENRIRLKNLIQKAQNELTLLDFRRPDIGELLAPTEDLVEGSRFSATEGPGLAIYLAQDFSRAYQLPYAPEEAIMVDSQFLIKPLMRLSLNEKFYILALDQQGVRLLQATQYTVERMELRNMPQSLADALRWDDPERELQWHSRTSTDVDGRAAIFHGHGVGSKETHKDNLLRYFQLLDQGLNELLANEDAPLVLAGVDYLLPIYRKASSYDTIIEEDITGSHHHLSDVEIHQQARKLFQPFFRRKREAAVSFYHQQASKALASDELTTVISAAHQGRVDTLFVALDEQIWGEYDPETSRIDLHPQPEPGDIDLLNLATIYTVLNSGNVYPSSHEDIPEAKPLAAIFRF